METTYNPTTGTETHKGTAADAVRWFNDPDAPTGSRRQVEMIDPYSEAAVMLADARFGSEPRTVVFTVTDDDDRDHTLPIAADRDVVLYTYP